MFFTTLIDALTDFNEFYSWVFFSFFITLTCLTAYLSLYPNSTLEKRIYWAMGIALIGFTALRPLGLGRDDLAYIDISKSICPISECLKLQHFSRDWGWYLLAGILKSLIPNPTALLVISAFGTFMQLYIIDKLCTRKLLAFTLFIPLTYIYFDFTLLRAGSAITLFFIAFYFLVLGQKILGSGIFLSNYFFHSQGIFSIGIIPFSFASKFKNLLTALIILALACIYLGWTPSANQLSFLAKTESQLYLDQYHSGIFSQEKKFPDAYLLIIAYLIFILYADKMSPMINFLQRFSLASILLAVFLAWIFAPIHIAQTRLFDFYVSPLIFLAGNLKPNKYTLVATLSLAILLYIRMELIHNWILG
ncbi:EpsG family protein [Polynucleobacter sp. AP-Capit-er-40B-B4]|uniref:EpsG family protein n=1 Tax=Polynucleobacter sp. AP-Capit-er-40B-B4 TaxID=2576927 RepID=UPI001C0C8F04|nr:EpsG family protein [Polynucleobacter sp. AP-Capit-er-40B-B4]MBU3580988.1 EpsG family protein [Polynucleobacter sp. AP-Capit-er-40B-B4]